MDYTYADNVSEKRQRRWVLKNIHKKGAKKYVK